MRTKFMVVLFGVCLALASATVTAAGSFDRPAAVPLDPDYEAGNQAIEAKNWSGAIRPLTVAAERDPTNPDIQNSLGYANRKLGQLDLAFKYYGRALELEPKHRGAHEYLGEAYLMVDNLAKAEEHLAALDKICFFPCDEYSDLKKSIAEYRLRKSK